MAKIIGIQYKENGKVYYFDPGEHELQKGDMVIVETVHGLESGTCVIPNREIPDKNVVRPLKPIIRPATEKDVETIAQNRKKEAHAMQVCREKIRALGLDMSLVEAQYSLDGSKVTMYYTCPNRVDFRELVKSLAYTLRARVELRQIGVRDEARMLGGLGICGRAFCCKTFLQDFQPVTIKMAKEQGMSLNSEKISGSCGRLMCCLKYEQDAYEELIHQTPKNGSIVDTPHGRGRVQDSNLLTGMLKVQLDQRQDAAPMLMHRSEVQAVRVKKETEPQGEKRPDEAQEQKKPGEAQGGKKTGERQGAKKKAPERKRAEKKGAAEKAPGVQAAEEKPAAETPAEENA